MKRYRHMNILVPLVLLSVMTLACGLNPLRRVASLVTEMPATLEAIASEVGEEQPGEATPSPAADESSEESLEVPSLTSGLTALESYVSRLEITLREPDSATAVQTLVMEIEHTREPLAERVVARGAEEYQNIQLVKVGGRQYVVNAEGQCVSVAAEEGSEFSTDFADPGTLLGGLQGARRVLPDEKVNGVLCRHYVFDESALLGVAHYTRAQGEVWVAVDGGYVMRYVLEAEGTDPATSKQGQVRIHYEVHQVNVPLTIEPPAGCVEGLSQYPMMPDASNVMTVENTVMYDTASTLDDVVAFYQEQMPAQGWAEAEAPMIMEEAAILRYTRDGQTVSVMISVSEEGKTTVMVSPDT